MVQYSIIIPVYNVEKYLPACLDSILAQISSSSWEAILVDDGSTDGSGIICDDYATQDTRFHVIHKKNGGVSGARNTGLQMANGMYVLYLDADDFWAPYLLTELDRILVTCPDMATFAYDRITQTEEKIFYPISVLPKGEPGEVWLERLFSCSTLPGPTPWCYAFRREFLLENQLFFREDLQVSEDFECNMRALAVAKQIVGSNKSLYGYRVREGSATASLSEKKVMDNLICKAEAFRRFPVSVLADLYVSNALLVAYLPKQQAVKPLLFLHNNRDILKKTSAPAERLASYLMRLFGDYTGSRVFCWLQKIKQRLERKQLGR